MARREAPTHETVVDHIVVQQRAEMDELADAHQARDGKTIADGACPERRQRGPQSLAAGIRQVSGDRGYRRHIAVDQALEFHLGRSEFLCHEAKGGLWPLYHREGRSGRHSSRHFAKGIATG